MLEFDTPVRRSIRAFNAPNSAEFDITEWRALFESSKLDTVDFELYATAYWLFAQSLAVREYFSKKPTPFLSIRASTLLATAMLNRECFVASEKFQKASRAARKDGALSIDHLANVGIGRADGLFEVDISSFADSATDMTESWLFDAWAQLGGSNTCDDWGDAARRNVLRFSLQRGHYDLWQHALWEDWRLIGDGSNRFAFAPADREFAKLLDACLSRKLSNMMEYAWIDIACWPQMTSERRRSFQLPLTVTGLERKPGRARRFIVGRPSSSARSVPPYVVGRAALQGSYLASFLERALPKAPELSCELIQRAWYVLLDLAEELAQRRPQATFHSADNVRQWALVTRHAELLDVLSRTLSVSETLAETLLVFLSWSPGCCKGLWGAPLVPLPNGDEFVIAHHVLAASNPVRCAEIWLTKGGLDDNLAHGGRGDSYEVVLRSEIRTELAENEVVRMANCAEHGVKKTKDFPQQIDLLVRFSSLLLVGEVKCFLFPTDPRERFNFLIKLRKAAEQARTKADLIKTRPDVAARALGIDEALAKTLTVVPIVVVNQGFGMSIDIDGCVVTDAKFLKLYLGSGSYQSEGAVNRIDGRFVTAEQELYRNEAEAVVNFAPVMRKPPPLYRFVDRLRWTSFGFPTYNGHPLIIARTELTDVSGNIRERYAALQELVESPDRLIAI